MTRDDPESPPLLRPAQPEDAEAIERVRSAGWRAAYRGIMPDAYLDEYHGNAEHRRRRIVEGQSVNLAELVALGAGGQIVGWVVAAPADRDEDLDSRRVAEIGACYVAPEHWGRGTGRRLMTAALAEVSRAGHLEVSLWVLRDNAGARGFYASCGFRPDGREKEHDFGGPVTSVRYRRNVVPGQSH